MIEGTAKLYIIHDIHSPGIRCIQFLIISLPGIIKFKQDPQVIYDGLNSFKIGNPMFVGFDFLKDDTGSFCIGPEIRVECELFSFF